MASSKAKNDDEGGDFGDGDPLKRNEELDALEDIDVMLDETRPRHIVEGVASGIGYIVAGAVGAAGILVLSPGVGGRTGYRQQQAPSSESYKEKRDGEQYQQQDEGGSWVGAVVGGLAGTVGGVGSAVSVAAGGLASGVLQISRGLVNTPASFVEPRRGKWWSAYEGKWIKTHLKSEMEWIETQPEFDEDLLGDEAVPEDILMMRDDEQEKFARAREYGVHDTDLYDIIGVDPDATDEDIKRRYKQVGKLFSPTRQGADNPKAQARYQKIGTAYVILTNKEMRARYDKLGMDAIYGEGAPEEKKMKELVNPAKLYGVMYGSDKFTAYIGRLAAASEASVGIQKSSKITMVEARLLQKRRVTRLAVQLAERLKKWTKGLHDEAVQDWEKEAELLCDANHGRQLVHLIGSAYSVSAAQFLGSFESGIGMPSIGRWAQKQYLTMTAGTKKTAKKVETFAGDVKHISLEHVAKSRFESSGAMRRQGGAAALEDSVTVELFDAIGDDVLEMLWTRTAVDVTNTIHEASQMVLFDADLNDETRKMRGEGLERLGEIFQNAEYGQSEDSKESESEYEKIAFYAVLDTIRKQEIASRNAGRTS